MPFLKIKSSDCRKHCFIIQAMLTELLYMYIREVNLVLRSNQLKIACRLKCYKTNYSNNQSCDYHVSMILYCFIIFYTFNLVLYVSLSLFIAKRPVYYYRIIYKMIIYIFLLLIYINLYKIHNMYNQNYLYHLYNHCLYFQNCTTLQCIFSWSNK